MFPLPYESGPAAPADLRGFFVGVACYEQHECKQRSRTLVANWKKLSNTHNKVSYRPPDRDRFGLAVPDVKKAAAL